jgi:MFS family permease
MLRDGKIILVEKAVRRIPYGFLGVLFAVYLSQLGFDALAIGIVLTLTTASSTVYTLIATLLGDRMGRRRTLIFFALTDILAGALLFTSSSWWAPVAAGIVGNMTVGAGEVGPYLSLEQAILPRTSDYKHRTMTFSIYNLTGYAASSGGALLAGVPSYLGNGLNAYRPLFMAYFVSGLLGALMRSRLSGQIEQENPGGPNTRVLSTIKAYRFQTVRTIRGGCFWRRTCWK